MDVVKNIFLGIFLMYFLLDVGGGIVLATKDMNVVQKMTRDIYSKKFLLYTIFVVLLGIGLIWLLCATDDNCPSWITKPDTCWDQGVVKNWAKKIGDIDIDCKKYPHLPICNGNTPT